MCGIFGIVASSQSDYSKEFLSKSLYHLASLSESRGKDSSGLCTFDQEKEQITVTKAPLPISKLLKKQEIKKAISCAFMIGDYAKYAFGHARLVTNGSQLKQENNQPIVKDGLVGVHNGIIVNADTLWEQHQAIKRNYEIDTEVMLARLREELNHSISIESAVSGSIKEIYGTVATAIVADDLNNLILATNNGSLYTLHNNKDLLIFASERYTLVDLIDKVNLSQIGEFRIQQVQANNGVIVDLSNYSTREFTFKLEKEIIEDETKKSKVPIIIQNIVSGEEQLSAIVDLNQIHLNPHATKERSMLDYPSEKIGTLVRCTKCILPATFPFIHFDQQGECNYCKSYIKKNQARPIEELEHLVDPYRRSNGSPEVIVPLSGGRDSTYVLHLIKEELGLNPVAYTYDWGMVTDLARRNVARICGKLGVENIIVAANIHWKRENIRKNITAWLKKPALGMIPLFMAGDKYFFYYAHKIKKQLGVDLEIWGVNHLENTNFKTGFAGLAPQFDKKWIYSLSMKNQLKLFGFVGKNMIQSPKYINQSILDSLGSIASRYITPKSNYFHFFDYFQWNEKVIEETIINHYDWEKAVDTDSTWRIGDGTASFYNYIYTLVAGFSENDTFRSNQIREGMITREMAMEFVEKENEPRYNSLKWYLEIIGLDYTDTINAINKIPRLY
jgi:glutamine---fructose-6-phosphate transaminase (isomerizing)